MLVKFPSRHYTFITFSARRRWIMNFHHQRSLSLFHHRLPSLKDGSENLIWKYENMRIFIVVTTAVQSLLPRRPHMRSSRASAAQFRRASRAKFGTSARHLLLGQKWKLWRNELPREYIGYKKGCISEICQFSDHCRGGATPHQRPGGVRTQKPKNPKGAIFTPFI